MSEAINAIRGLRLELVNLGSRGFNIGYAVELLESLEHIAIAKSNTAHLALAIAVRVYESVLTYDRGLKARKLYDLMRLILDFCYYEKQLCEDQKLEDKARAHLKQLL